MLDATSMPQNVVVLGGSSDIAKEFIKLLSSRRLEKILLVGRNKDKLDEFGDELRNLNIEPQIFIHDTRNFDSAQQLANVIKNEFTRVDLLLVATGMLGNANIDALGLNGVQEMIEVNFTGPAIDITSVLPILKDQRGSRVIALSSVAAIRPRKDNYIYSAAKSGFDNFLQGIAKELEPYSVETSIVRFGFVKTSMTTGLKPVPFTIELKDASQLLMTVLEKRKTGIIYLPPILKYLFLILKNLPDTIWWKISERS